VTEFKAKGWKKVGIEKARKEQLLCMGENKNVQKEKKTPASKVVSRGAKNPSALTIKRKGEGTDSQQKRRTAYLPSLVRRGR